jgi:uncharacterized protein involved in outer membrane biogenesis
MKKAFWSGVAVLVLLAGSVLVLPAFIDLGIFKSTYLPLVEEALGRRIDVSELRLSFLPAPSIRLANLKISDGPAFPDNTFFAADQLQMRLKLWPLLRGRFEVSEFILEKPVINLLKHPDGTFNYSDLAGKKLSLGKKAERKSKSAQVKTAKPATIPLLLPARMRIKDGQFNLETKGQKPVLISGIELSLEEFSTEQPFPYRASFNYPGLQQVSLEGQISYREEQGTLTFTKNLLKAMKLTLPIEGTVSSLTTTPQVQLSSVSERVDAKPVFAVLSVFGLAPQATEVSGPMTLSLSVRGPSNHLVTEISGQFIDVRVDGKRALKGNLSGDVALKLPFGSGPATRRLQGSGKLVARDGEFTNVNLIKKVQRVTGMMGLTKAQGKEATTFKTLESEFTIGNGSADFKRIYLTNPQMEVAGNGTLTLEQPTLDMAIETTLLVAPAGRLVRGGTAAIFKNSHGRPVVPLKITGPLESPAVNLDVAKIAQKGTFQAIEKRMGSAFKQLFK